MDTGDELLCSLIELLLAGSRPTVVEGLLGTVIHVADGIANNHVFDSEKKPRLIS